MIITTSEINNALIEIATEQIIRYSEEIPGKEIIISCCNIINSIVKENKNMTVHEVLDLLMLLSPEEEVIIEVDGKELNIKDIELTDDYKTIIKAE